MAEGRSNIKPDRTLDAQGLFCPEPVFRTNLEMQKMMLNQILEVLADDPGADPDISSWAKRTGQQLISLTKEGRRLRFLLRKLK